MRSTPAPPHARSGASPRRAVAAWVGSIVISLMVLVCIGTLPWTLASGADGMPRYNAGSPSAGRLPPWWVPANPDQRARASNPVLADASGKPPRFWMGSDVLGRSLLVRSLAGGGISLLVGVCAAMLSVCIGTLYGVASGYAGGRLDAVMMRTVDVLYGLPYVLLVVLLAVASDAVVDEYISRQRERTALIRSGIARELAAQGRPAERVDVDRAIVAKDPVASTVAASAMQEVPPRRVSGEARSALDLATLIVAIAGVSWLTMARVVRAQVLSLKTQAFVLAARTAGASPWRVFTRHLLPNLSGIIIVYATLTVPQAILQEAFLSFLGVGVKPPLPSWGSLASEGLGELNPYQSNWWLLVVPSVLIGVTLLALNFVGEGLREALDPRRAGRP